MRILMISIDRTLLGADYSGDVLERHQKYAQESGQLDIIIFTKKGFKKKEFDKNLKIYPTNSKTKLNYIFDAFKIAKNIYWPDKFDLIVCQDPFLTGLAGWFIKKRFKIPLLIHFHGDFWNNKYWLFEKGRWWFNWSFLILSKFIVSRADGIRVVSSGIRDKLIKADISEKKIRVIPTPVDVNKFGNPNLRAVDNFRKIHNNFPVILNVGRYDGAKDFKTFRKTLPLIYEKFRKIVFWQVGADLSKRRMGKEFEKMTMSFTGLAAMKMDPKVEQNSLINIYHASDIYVSSSCSESFGKVLVEAMAAGLPVIATATTGSQEVVENGVNGFLVPIGDNESLAKKILYLLNNPDKAKKMGQAGKQMVEERFNQEKIIREVIRFWEDLEKND